MNIANISVIGFDADDTLWHNEGYFRQTEAELADMLAPFHYPTPIGQLIYERQMANLSLYGYGIKSFTLAMIETAFIASKQKVSPEIILWIIQRGKEMLSAPVELIQEVDPTLALLSQNFKLVVVTKGDLVDQQRKLRISGLFPYFHHIEIVSDKTASTYAKLCQQLDIEPSQFFMVGNSLKSDVLPVLKIGAHAIHIPYLTTWEHEKHPIPEGYPQFYSCKQFSELPHLLS